MIKFLKGFCSAGICVCLIIVLVLVSMFDDGSIHGFWETLLAICALAFVAVVFFFCYLTCEKIEDDNKEWMELGKKKAHK